jgi:hypothetical protein
MANDPTAPSLTFDPHYGPTGFHVTFPTVNFSIAIGPATLRLTAAVVENLKDEPAVVAVRAQIAKLQSLRRHRDETRQEIDQLEAEQKTADADQFIERFGRLTEKRTRLAAVEALLDGGEGRKPMHADIDQARAEVRRMIGPVMAEARRLLMAEANAAIKVATAALASTPLGQALAPLEAMAAAYSLKAAAEGASPGGLTPAPQSAAVRALNELVPAA